MFLSCLKYFLLITVILAFVNGRKESLKRLNSVVPLTQYFSRNFLPNTNRRNYNSFTPCQGNFYYEPSFSKCIPRKSYYEYCANDQMCSFGLRCFRGRCYCGPNQFYSRDDYRCLGYQDAYCLNTNDCFMTNNFGCNQATYKCSCDKGFFYQSKNYTCSPYPQRVCQLGCFTDPGRDAMRDEIVAYVNDQSNTVEKCLNTCTKKYYSHAGLSEGGTCVCGRSTGETIFSTSIGICNIACPGNPNQMCGGTAQLSNSVYKYDANC